MSDERNVFQKICITLPHPRKDDGETLRCCLRNGRGIEPRQFLPKKGLRLTLSVVCLAGTKAVSDCLNKKRHWPEIGEYYTSRCERTRSITSSCAALRTAPPQSLICSLSARTSPQQWTTSVWRNCSSRSRFIASQAS